MELEQCRKAARELRIGYEIRELFHEANRLPADYPKGREECFELALDVTGEPVRVYRNFRPYDRFEE